MEINAFKYFMGNPVWDLDTIFNHIDVEKEFRNHRYVIKRELETLTEYSIIKMTSLFCELLRSKTLIDYDYIKYNFDSLTEVSRNTLHYYTITDKLDILSEYIGGAIKLSIENCGFIYNYKLEADALDMGVNQLLINTTNTICIKSNKSDGESFKIIFFAWLLFDSSVNDLGRNAFKLIEKECFGFTNIR